jgi:hypothetical protein
MLPQRLVIKLLYVLANALLDHLLGIAWNII